MTPTNVTIRHTEECYEEIPVIVGNTTWFLTPETHILVKTETLVDCDTIIPPYYKIDGISPKILRKKIVEKYEEYGMISSAIIMTIVICQFIKMMIDLIIRACALHALYGWSMKLLGAFFSSVTQ